MSTVLLIQLGQKLAFEKYSCGCEMFLFSLADSFSATALHKT